MVINPDDLSMALDKIRRFGPVRDRAMEREPRMVTLTDDEALALYGAVDGIVRMTVSEIRAALLDLRTRGGGHAAADGVRELWVAGNGDLTAQDCDHRTHAPFG